MKESQISRAIIERYFSRLTRNLDVDVAIAGAGPSGLVAARFIAEAGKRVAVFEKKLSLGGGIWGGGMLFNEIVIDREGAEILNSYGVESTEFNGMFTADSIETTAALIYRAKKAGVNFFNTVTVEDLIIRKGRVCGFVINWSLVEQSGLHVDPLGIESSVCLEATGHPLEIVRVLERKNDVSLDTESGGITGERSMHAEVAEQEVVSLTGRIFPGLYVSGMAACAVHGAPRMGPVFGGMLRSGKKVASLILEELDG